MAKGQDWEAIKTEYITTEIGYRPLAAKWHVSWRTLSERAKRENWPQQRAEHKQGVVTKTVQWVQAETVRTNASNLLKLQRSADKMVDVVEAVFEDVDQFHRHLVVQKHGFEQDTVEKHLQKVNTKAIKDLTGAMRDLAAIIRDVYDLPSIQEQSAMDIAAERLRLEQRKADAAEKDGSDGVEVVLCAPELKEYSE